MFYDVNTAAAAADLTSRGVTVRVWNFEDRTTLPAGADAVFNAFQAQVAADGLPLYHGDLAPFCDALVRDFFEQVLASSP